MSYKSLNKLAFLTVALSIIAVVSPVFAVTVKHWTDNTESSFDAGTTKGAVITNLGDIKISSDTDLLAKLDSKQSVLYDMQYIGHTLYMAAGPQATLLVSKDGKDGKTSTVTTLDNSQIFALGTYKGKLLVAISGSPSKLAVLKDNKLKTIAVLKNVRYIWDTLTVGNSIILATGTKGCILSVTPGASSDVSKNGKSASSQPSSQPSAKITTILDTKQKNVMCLGRDGQGNIYAGTDTKGIVYKITKEGDKYSSYVLYQASEPEIDTLLVEPDGTVFAGTANAKQARPGRLAKPSKKQTGKPVPDSKNNTKDIKKSSAAKASTQQSKISDKENTKAQSNKNKPQTTEHKAKKNLKKNNQDKKKTSNINKTPTPQQYDSLREAVHKRLLQAQKSGVLDAGPMPSASPKSGHSTNVGPSRVETVSHHISNKQGNAVYKIDPQGFVHEIFRESVMVLDIAKDGNYLLITTGNEGKIYRVNPDTDITSILAKLNPEQLPVIVKNPDNNFVIGTANPATVVKLSSAYSKKGTYTSKVMDASQVSLWGKLNLTAGIPVNASVTVQTRSGNVVDPKDGGWSKWSVATGFSHSKQKSWMQPRQMEVNSPPARFFQYRLTLKGKNNNAPVVHGVNLAYVTPNLRPKLTSVTGEYSKGDDPAQMQVKWEASDPNDDTLSYTLDYRPAGAKNWINIKKDISSPQFSWQTRQVPDGYYQLKVTASDSPSNPPSMAMTDVRVSNPVLVDNTAPIFTGLLPAIDGDSVTLHGAAKDNYSNIASIGYVVDSDKDYTAILPDDLIFDSTQEKFHVKISNLKKGSHVVTFKVEDSRGNTSYKSIPFTINSN